MANYLLAYHGGQMADTPEARERSFAAWGQWFASLGGAVVDGGNPVSRSTTIAGDTVSDGGGANPVNGYSILRADTLDAAVALAKGCPILENGGSVEVCETFNAM